MANIVREGETDIDALAEYTAAMNRNFNSIIKTINNMEKTFKNITSIGIWDADSRDYFIKMSKSIEENFDIINNHFTNIGQSLNTTVSNYRSVDSM